jgi:mono/diheme cytochrome c family protein
MAAMLDSRPSLILVLLVVVTAFLSSCRAKAPGAAEAALVNEMKKESIGGKNWSNPQPDTPENQRTGAEHFQHHCQVCHGLDGHNTGVPFADAMSPQVADLGDKRVQAYTDGQLKWIILNGIRFTGMPGWNGILDDNEQWAVIHYLRHLPAKGSLGPPAVYREWEEEHHHAEEGHGTPEHQHGSHEHKQ